MTIDHRPAQRGALVNAAVFADTLLRDRVDAPPRGPVAGTGATPRTETGEPLIRLRGVTKTYGQGQAAFKALKGIDLDIARGDFVAIDRGPDLGVDVGNGGLGAVEHGGSPLRRMSPEPAARTRDRRAAQANG